MATRTTPLAVVGKGLVAGLIGTGAMTAYQVAVARIRDSESSSAPAEVAKRIIGGVLDREVPEGSDEALNNGMHVLYGMSWGPLYGLVHSSNGNGGLGDGIGFGLGVWAASLVHLPAMKIAPPIWETPLKEAAIDASYHLVYGLGVAAAYAAIDR